MESATELHTKWAEYLGGLLDDREAARRLHLGVEHVKRLAATDELIVVSDRSGQGWYPAFQFRRGAPPRHLLDAWHILVAAYVDPWTAASWFASPDPALAGQSPADWIAGGRDTETLLRIARQDAAKLDC